MENFNDHKNPKLGDRQAWTNIVNPDQMLQNFQMSWGFTAQSAF